MIRDIGSSAFGARRNKAGPASRSTTRRLRYAMLSFLTLSTVIMASIATQSAPVGATTNWSPTTGCGIVDTTVVPPFVYSMTVTVVGGSGGQASYGTWGGTEIHTPGYGGTVTSTIAVTPGQTISAIIGCEEGKLGFYPNKVTANQGHFISPETLASLKEDQSKRLLMPFLLGKATK